jgi:hypothetical protein
MLSIADRFKDLDHLRKTSDDRAPLRSSEQSAEAGPDSRNANEPLSRAIFGTAAYPSTIAARPGKKNLLIVLPTVKNRPIGLSFLTVFLRVLESDY